jgi:hypothetical protein
MAETVYHIDGAKSGGNRFVLLHGVRLRDACTMRQTELSFIVLAASHRG